MDAEDESLARWKASLGIVPGASSGPAVGPKVGPSHSVDNIGRSTSIIKVTVLALELHSPTLPAGKKLSIDLKDAQALAGASSKNPITIKEGVEYT